MLTDVKDFYTNEWHGEYNGADLNKLIDYSCDVVNNAIAYSGFLVSSVPDFFKSNVYKAVCSQVDFVVHNGGTDSLYQDSMTSVTLGKFSYTQGNGNVSNAIGLCDLSISYLLPTGLMYQGVDIL